MLWFLFLKPQVKSTAKSAAQKAVASPQTQAAIQAKAAQAGKTAAQQAAAGQPATGAAAPAPAAGATPTTVVTGANGLKGTPIDNRLVGTASFTVPNGKTLQMTDIVLENPPNDDQGTLTVERSGTVLLSVALQNFRDLDYHFVAPIIFNAGQQVQVVSNVTTCTGVCTPAIYYSGYMENAGQ